MIIIFTGDGKGKTSAAMGTAIRAYGQGKRVLIVSFLKAPNVSGELKVLKELDSDQIQVFSYGRDCPYPTQDCCPGHHECIVTSANRNDQDNDVILAGLNMCRNQLSLGKWDVVILDELLNVYNLFPEHQQIIMDFIINKSPALDLLITGRDCPEELINIAHYVTDMKMIKHPFLLGVTARKGIDY